MKNKSYADALAICKTVGQDYNTHMETETVDTCRGAGRVLAEAVAAVRNVPHYRAAAMDGVALRFERLCHGENLLLDTAGPVKQEACLWIEKAETVAVYTGQPVPENCDTVVPVEHIQELEGRLYISHTPVPNQHIRSVGEDVREGQVLYKKGWKVYPHDVGVLLLSGVGQVRVYKRPHIRILPTGSEVRAPLSSLTAGDVPESNGTMLQAMLEQLGASASIEAVVPDDPTAIRSAIQTALLDADGLLVIAGSSVGKRDYVPAVLSEMGTVYFRGVGMRPGHPAHLTRVEGKPVLGIPGYPGSAATVMDTLGAALVHGMSGAVYLRPVQVQSSVAVDWKGKQGYHELVRAVQTDQGHILPMGKGGGPLHSLAQSEGYMHLPADQQATQKGQAVDFQLRGQFNQRLK